MKFGWRVWAIKNEYKLTSAFERIGKSTKPYNIISILIRNVVKLLAYYAAIIFDYILFILPLSISVLIFVQPTLLEYIGVSSDNIWNISFWRDYLLAFHYGGYLYLANATFHIEKELLKSIIIKFKYWKHI